MPRNSPFLNTVHRPRRRQVMSVTTLSPASANSTVASSVNPCRDDRSDRSAIQSGTDWSPFCLDRSDEVHSVRSGRHLWAGIQQPVDGLGLPSLQRSTVRHAGRRSVELLIAALIASRPSPRRRRPSVALWPSECSQRLSRSCLRRRASSKRLLDSPPCPSCRDSS